MLDEVGVIHMNGRIYDAKIARFLQADPFVQDPFNSQSQNRYSYVWNNPLNATDPSGYFVFTLAALVYTAVTTGIKWYVAAAIFGAAAFGDALLQGASFGDALKSGIIAGVSAAAFAGIGDYLGGGGFAGDFAAGLDGAGFALKVGAHGAIGGITSVLQGGEFGHGFAAAGFTALAASFNNSKFIGGKGYSTTRVAIGAVIGGTASKLSGGKFSNGAVTGAFSQALNNEQTEIEKAKSKKYKLGIGVEAPRESATGPDGLNINEDTGHTFSYAVDGDGNIVGVVSFGPGERIGASNGKDFLEGNLDGRSDWPLVGEATVREWEVSEKAFNTYMTDAAKVLTSPPKYTPSCQCTSTAIDLLKGTGVSVPDGRGTVYYKQFGVTIYNETQANPYHLLKQLNELGGTRTESTDIFK